MTDDDENSSRGVLRRALEGVFPVAAGLAASPGGPGAMLAATASAELLVKSLEARLKQDNERRTQRFLAEFARRGGQLLPEGDPGREEQDRALIDAFRVLLRSIDGSVAPALGRLVLRFQGDRHDPLFRALGRFLEESTGREAVALAELCKAAAEALVEQGDRPEQIHLRLEQTRVEEEWQLWAYFDSASFNDPTAQPVPVPPDKRLSWLDSARRAAAREVLRDTRPGELNHSARSERTRLGAWVTEPLTLAILIEVLGDDLTEP